MAVALIVSGIVSGYPDCLRAVQNWRAVDPASLAEQREIVLEPLFQSSDPRKG